MARVHALLTVSRYATSPGHVIGLAEDVARGVPGSRTAEEEAATVRDDVPARRR